MIIIEQMSDLNYYYMWLKLVYSWVNITTFLLKEEEIRKSATILLLN